MSSTLTTFLSLVKAQTGQRNWGDTLNSNLDLIDAELKRQKDTDNTLNTTISSTNTTLNNTITNQVTTLNSRIDGIIGQTGNSNTEIVDGRTDVARSKTFTTLKGRLDQDSIDITNNINNITNNIQAVREAIHSGFTTLPILSYSASTPNIVTVTNDAVAFINGYRVKIPANTVITMPDAPLIGYREDLVFLEFWLASQSNGTYLPQWRIRTVAGVNFNEYPEGLIRSNGWGWSADYVIKPVATPQGGNTQPLLFDQTTVASRFNTGFCSTSVNTGFLYKQDVGLVVAGLGDQNSKDLLKTVDGFVYAITLLKIKRRNNGGYSVSNPNGGEDYFAPTTASITILEPNYTGQRTVSNQEEYDKINVGDVFINIPTPTTKWVVLSKDGNLTLTVKNISVTGNIGALTTSNYYRVSKRPDGKFANVIDVTDIEGGDLWHKVSFTGINYQSVMEENFFKLLRSELITTQPKKMIKTYHGLPAIGQDASTLLYCSFNGDANGNGGSYIPTKTGAGIPYYTRSVSGSGMEVQNLYNYSYPVAVDPNVGTIELIVKPHFGRFDDTNTKRILNIVTANGNRLFFLIISQGTGGNGVRLEWKNIDNANITNGQLISTNQTWSMDDFLFIKFEWDKVNNYHRLEVNGVLVQELPYPTGVTTSAPTAIEVGDSLVSISKYQIAELRIYNTVRNPRLPHSQLPNDVLQGHAKVMQSFDYQRLVHSDALTSQYTRSFAKLPSVGASDRCVTVTKVGANAAIWEATDTIKVIGLGGEIISGVIDTDTALARVIADVPSSTSTVTFYVDDVTKFTVSDTFRMTFYSGSLDSHIFTVSAIDSTLKTITATFSGTVSAISGALLFETTASSSSPVVKYSEAGTLTVVPGTWANLGTNAPVFTLGDLSGIPNFDIETVQIEYSLNIPAGNGGISEVYSETLQGSVKGKKLITGTVAVRDDYAGKIAGSTVVCPCVSKSAVAATLLVPTDVGWTELIQGEYDKIKTLDGVPSTVTTSVNGNYSLQSFSYNLIREVEDKHGTIPALDVPGKVQWLKDSFSKLTGNVWGYGSSAGGNLLEIYIWKVTTSAWIKSASNNAVGTVQKISYNAVTGLADYITADGFVHFLVSAPVSNGVTASTINIDYPNCEIELKSLTGYDMLVPENPRRDDGLSGVLQVRKETKEIQSYFPLVNTDQVTTWGNYVPYQGVGDLGEGSIIAIGKPIITNYGTGGVLNYADNIYGSPLIHKLPSFNHYSYNFNPAEAILTDGTGKISFETSLSPNYIDQLQNNIYRKRVIIGQFKRATSMSPIRGIPLRFYPINSQQYLQLAFKDNFTNAVAILPLLAVVNNELVLIIITSNARVKYHDNIGWDMFKIPGRPLIK